MKFTDTDTFALTDEQISTTIAGESVILNYSQGKYYTLNEVGSFVWEQLQQRPQTLGSLVAAVEDNFDVETATCRLDLDALLNSLLHEKLVERVA